MPAPNRIVDLLKAYDTTEHAPNFDSNSLSDNTGTTRTADLLDRAAEILASANDKLPAKLTAYHVGHSAQLSVEHAGKGEGNNILGSGVYFSTLKDFALAYAKYTTTPVLTTATIDTSGLYDPIWGVPENLREKVVKLAAGLPRNYQTLKYGQGSIGDIFKAHGPKKGRELLAIVGVTGAYERLPSGYVEIAVYDLSILSDQTSEDVSKDVASSVETLAKVGRAVGSQPPIDDEYCRWRDLMNGILDYHVVNEGNDILYLNKTGKGWSYTSHSGAAAIKTGGWGIHPGIVEATKHSTGQQCS